MNEEAWEEVGRREPSAANVPVTDVTFSAAVCFSPAVNATSIADVLLESYSGLQAFVLAKRWEEIFKEAKELLHDRAINSTNAKVSTIEIGGHTVAQAIERALPCRWAYEDETLDRLTAQADQLKIAIKARQAALQAAKEGVPDMNGEILIPAQKIECGITVAIKYV